MTRMNGLMGVVVSSLAVLVVVIVGWLFFVSPQRSKADRIGAQADAAHAELMGDEQLIAAAKRQNTLGNAKAAERALPDDAKVSEILRQLTGFAAESRTELDNITPGAALQVGNAQALPITLTFKGRYFGLQKLLKLMRQSAGVSGNKIVSKGRLYTVDSITFAGAAPATGTNGATAGGSTADIQATITLNAFIYKAAPSGSDVHRHHDGDGRGADGLMTSTAAEGRRRRPRQAARRRNVANGHGRRPRRLLVVVLAFEVPKLMKAASGSSTTALRCPTPVALRRRSIRCSSRRR